MPLATPRPLTCTTAGEAATAGLAARLANLALPGDVLALVGGLGSGKTVFARGFVRALLGVPVEVPSPTFTLVQTYEAADGGLVAWHFDLFRLEQPDDAFELDIEEAFASGVSLIEWPERLGGLLPASRLDVLFTPGDHADERRITLQPHGADWISRLAEFGDVG